MLCPFTQYDTSLLQRLNRTFVLEECDRRSLSGMLGLKTYESTNVGMYLTPYFETIPSLPFVKNRL